MRRPGETHNDGSDVAGRGGRDVLAVLAVVLLVAALVPPLSTKARTVEALEALQFALLALAVPALAVLGTPWRRLGLAAPPSARVDAEGVTVSERPGVADRVAAARRRHRHMGRSLSYVLADMAVVVAWRVPASVDALARHGWLSVVEAVTLVPAGIGLWLELVGSSPFAHAPRPAQAHGRGRRVDVGDLGDGLRRGALARGGVHGLCAFGRAGAQCPRRPGCHHRRAVVRVAVRFRSRGLHHPHGVAAQ